MKTIEEIKEKANYCLNCKLKPCSSKGCPLGNNIPQFIEKIKKGNYEEAYKLLSETTVLPGVCGRICPHEKQCQGSCVRAVKGDSVAIGELETFISDKFSEDENSLLRVYNLDGIKIKNNNIKKVAVVGSGPAGLTCSAFLARSGIEVTIFEKYNYLGGLLVHGIPDFRLPKKIVTENIKKILKLGIKVQYNIELGKDINLEYLLGQYDAVFLGIGANVSFKMGIPGENLRGVYGGNELLEHNLHPDYTGKTVSVIGGGNVAMDCARTIKRLGAKKVNVIYRRAKEQMPAEAKEVRDAINEGINFIYQNNLLKIFGKDKVENIELIKTRLVKKDSDTRLVPVNIEESNYTINTDFVVMALGSVPHPVVSELGLDTNKWGNVVINEKYQTSNPKIYAGGDLSGTKSTVAWAAYSGREAARNIIENIQ